jgi:hypothetical protein
MLDWNEIYTRAQQFAKEWQGETRERGEYQLFWEDFFNVFGIKRRSVALYQKKVEILGNHRGFVDLFWPGMLLVEHKSAGKDLDAAFTQATDYFDGLKEEEKPRYVIVTDYNTFRFYDLEGERAMGEFGMTQKEFTLEDLPKHIRLFAFVAGHEVCVEKGESPAKILWEDVKFIRGQDHGHSYRLEFIIAGQEIIIKCSDVEILSADCILRKMQLATRKLIECPYTGKHGKQNWLPRAVFPWLEQISMQHAKQENRSDVIRDFIRDFASKPIWKETFDSAFSQTRDPVREDNTIFIPFGGLRTYVRKMAGTDTGERYLTTVLLNMNARRVRKGKDRSIFYALNYDQLENTALGSAGIGKDNLTETGSEKSEDTGG